ncbi:fumarylacetoacetate hydrolase family protein [Pararhodobacter zhoushanensis]|uniref:Fumarylacetoacetate hydrolase family protein n=1 Tax=Pararhodobacter zhoushanensis TaxID=2479545 RepID=A0ABT3GXS0_9RHOB|nr:fumarylacetoacetate hydrolase family protein [Pararhodobacter zhoushanensis]MCW1932290.1 fumarylacetoacetate hydrolase family protein [Pararhodobacter zhoushanensis]
MQFATGHQAGQTDRLWFRDGDTAVDLDATLSKRLTRPLRDIEDLLDASAASPGLMADLPGLTASAPRVAVSALTFAPPVRRPSKVLGVAFNNRELMKTAHHDPGVPNFFLKPPSCLIGHGADIEIDPSWGPTIPEPEICAIIGRRARRVTEAEALDHVFGWTIINDVTSHGLKFGKDSIAVTYPPALAHPEFFAWRNRHGDDDRNAYFVYHTRSKGADTFGPVGPWVTTADKVGNPNDLSVVADIDGEVFARDNTANYRFRVETCIAEASRYFTLEPGDMICFGTTGKGEGRFPNGHKSLLLNRETGRIGISVDGLGRLENGVRHITT